MRVISARRLAAGVAILTFGSLLAACGTAPSDQGAAPTNAPSGSASSEPSAPSTTSASPSSTPTPAPSPSKTPKPKPKKAKAMLKKGDTGDKVRELQSRLKQIDWYAPKITPNYDDVTVESVKGFQEKREVPATGEVDKKTWALLGDMTRKPTDDEMHNRLTPGPAIHKLGSEGDKVRDLQARLKQIGWYSGKVTGYYGDDTASNVKGFQEKREIPDTGEVDQRTWDRLVAMTHTPTKDEKHNKKPKAKKAAGLDDRCMTGRALCISKSTNQLVWVIDGKEQSRMDVRFGSDELPTREGAFSVFMKSRDHVSTIYHTSMPFAMFFSGGQAVHFSPDFAANGYNGASHGCVNVRDRNAVVALFDQVRNGDKVIVYT